MSRPGGSESRPLFLTTGLSCLVGHEMGWVFSLLCRMWSVYNMWATSNKGRTLKIPFYSVHMWSHGLNSQYCALAKGNIFRKEKLGGWGWGLKNFQGAGYVYLETGEPGRRVKGRMGGRTWEFLGHCIPFDHPLIAKGVTCRLKSHVFHH